MGQGIAFTFALGGYPTFMQNLSDKTLQEAMGNIKSTADLFVAEEMLTPQAGKMPQASAKKHWEKSKSTTQKNIPGLFPQKN